MGSSGISPLVYDTGTAAEVWRRVEPALPAYGEAVCPTGVCCPLPRCEADGETELGRLIADTAGLYAHCRRCAARSPRSARGVLGLLAQEQQRTVRSLLAAYFLHTGRWYQPPAPPPTVREPWLTALRRVYMAEAVLQRDCTALAARMADGCLRQLLTAEAQRAADRAKKLAVLLENTLTTGNNLLKW